MPDDPRDPLICIRIPPALDARLRADVAARGETISGVVRTLLDEAYPLESGTGRRPPRRALAPKGRVQMSACTHRVKPGSYCKRCGILVA
jgi:hypothetical protein